MFFISIAHDMFLSSITVYFAQESLQPCKTGKYTDRVRQSTDRISIFGETAHQDIST